MTYFCYIESAISTVPHMEPLSASTLEEALVEAAGLMTHHTSATQARVFSDGRELAGLAAADAASIRLNRSLTGLPAAKPPTDHQERA